jgi:hypothetical protein
VDKLGSSFLVILAWNILVDIHHHLVERICGAAVLVRLANDVVGLHVVENLDLVSVVVALLLHKCVLVGLVSLDLPPVVLRVVRKDLLKSFEQLLLQKLF